MHAELDPQVEAFIRQARVAAESAPLPAPDERLAALFTATGPACTTPARPTTSRRRPMKDLLASLPGKIAAGVFGASLAIGGLGVAGALPGSLTLTSSHEEVTEPAEDLAMDDATDDAAEEAAEAAEDAAEAAEDESEAEEEAPASEEPVDLSEVPVPTSQSEAAQTHAFDEACGNHGAYVSYFAHHGEEPPCATEARAAAAGEEGADAEAAETGDTADDDEPVAKNKGQQKKAERTSSAKTRAANGAGKGRK